MIHLDKGEIKLIKFCKGHYREKYDAKTGRWIDSLKIIFEEMYEWSPTEHYNDFLGCMFNKLLDIHLKIQLDQSGCNQQLKELFDNCFCDRWWNNDKLPIERGIVKLCGLIQCNTVIDNGGQRYSLKLEGEKEFNNKD